MLARKRRWKIVSIMIYLLVSFLFWHTALAIVSYDTTNYVITTSAASISLEFPETWKFVDIGESIKDPSFDEFHNDLIVLLEDDYYFVAFSNDDAYSFSADFMDLPMNDFNGLEDGVLTAAGKALRMELYSDYMVTKARVIKGNDKYIKYILRTESSDIICYMTVKSNKLFRFEFTSHTTEQEFLTNEQIFDAVIRSVTINSNNIFDSYYLDKLQFSIEFPNDYNVVVDPGEIKKISTDERAICVASSSDNDLYISVDGDDEIEDFMSFDDLDDSELNQYVDIVESVFESSLGIPLSNEKIVSIQGHRYIYFESDTSQIVSGGPFSCSYISVQNKHFFMIQIMSSSYYYEEFHQRYDADIEAIISSIVYTNENLEEVREKTFKDYSFRTQGRNIKISFPSSYYCYWKNMPSDATSLAIKGYSIDQWDEAFDNESGLCFWAEDRDRTETITLSVSPESSWLDLQGYTDAEIKRYIASMLYPEGNEIEQPVDKYYILRTASATFIISEMYMCESDLPHQLWAFAHIDGEMIQFIHDKFDEFTSEDIKQLINIVCTLSIDGVSNDLVSVSDEFHVDGSSEVEKIGNAYFRIPSRYMKISMETTSDDLCMKVRGADLTALKEHLKVNNLKLMYYTYDKEMVTVTFDETEESFEGLSDAYLEYYIQMLVESGGITVDKTTVVTYDDVRWVRLEFKNPSENYDCVCYLTIANRLVYRFDFQYIRNNNDHIKEYEDIISSYKYIGRF